MSSTAQRLSAGAVTTLAVTAVATPLTLLAAPAQAAMACAESTPVATLVGADICEVIMTTDGTFVAPSGVTKIQALVVGGGGGSANNDPQYGGYSYGGGGAEVVLVSSVSSGSHTVVVGAGGLASTNQNATNGGTTSLDTTDALGGGGAYNNGPSGVSPVGASNGVSNYYSDAVDCGDGITAHAYGEGAGAGGIAMLDAQEGAPGVAASGLAGADAALWPALLGETEYAPGGAACVTNVTPDVAGAGGSADGDVASDGHDGAVIFRWAAYEVPELPDTGFSVPAWLWGAGVAVAAAGGLLTSGLLRTRRNGRHSA